MRNKNILNNGIPISLNTTLEKENFQPKKPYNKKRVLTISSIAFLIAICVSFIA